MLHNRQWNPICKQVHEKAPRRTEYQATLYICGTPAEKQTGRVRQRVLFT